MLSWTTSCTHSGGDIYSWDIKKLKFDVSFTIVKKAEFCPGPNKEIMKQEPRKKSGKVERKRFKPSSPARSTLVGAVLKLITQPASIKNRDSEFMCFRLNGELIMIPPTKEEMALMDKTLRNYVMQRTNSKIKHYVSRGHILKREPMESKW